MALQDYQKKFPLIGMVSDARMAYTKPLPPPEIRLKKAEVGRYILTIIRIIIKLNAHA